MSINDRKSIEDPEEDELRDQERAKCSLGRRITRKCKVRMTLLGPILSE